MERSLRRCFGWKQLVIEQKAYLVIYVKSYETGCYNSVYKYRLINAQAEVWMGTQQIYNTAAVALGLGVMVKGSRNQGQEIIVWICHRRICSYIECVRINGWNWKKTRKREKETNNAEKKSQGEGHGEAERPWGGIWVKLFITTLTLLFGAFWTARVRSVEERGLSDSVFSPSW